MICASKLENRLSSLFLAFKSSDTASFAVKFFIPSCASRGPALRCSHEYIGSSLYCFLSAGFDARTGGDHDSATHIPISL